MKAERELLELAKKIPKGSGFFDVPVTYFCRNPEHNAPMHICIPQGKGYRHVCPGCGSVQTIIGGGIE